MKNYEDEKVKINKLLSSQFFFEISFDKDKRIMKVTVILNRLSLSPSDEFESVCVFQFVSIYLLSRTQEKETEACLRRELFKKRVRRFVLEMFEREYRAE